MMDIVESIYKAKSIIQTERRPSKNDNNKFLDFTMHVKARLHLQLLLRFSPFDGCEPVNQTRMFK